MEPEWLTTKEKAKEDRVSPTQVLRRARKGLYPGAHQPAPGGEWRFPAGKAVLTSSKLPTPETLAVEREYTDKLLAHYRDLRDISSRWKSELWLPAPWRWDIIDLNRVFYVNQRASKTGYKLPAELADDEENRGHLRQFDEALLYWDIGENGSISLRLPIEGLNTFAQLREHSGDSATWGLLECWKQEGGEYLQLCSNLLGAIDKDAKRTGAKSSLFAWVVYHDAFWVAATKFRCERCGAENPIAFRFCQECHWPLGRLHPIGTAYRRGGSDPKSSPIHIHGWGNVEESVETPRFEGLKRAHEDLKAKYHGCSMVETILTQEQRVRQRQAELANAVEALCSQRAFPERCEACPSRGPA